VESAAAAAKPDKCGKPRGGTGGGAGGGEHRLTSERSWPRSGNGGGAGDAPYLSLCGLYQRSSLGRQADLGVQESHPGSVPIALASERFLVVSGAQTSGSLQNQ
jgi:hypothetical protein